MRFEDLQSEGHFDGFEAYCRAKLANVLFTLELARRLEGTGVTANAVHPGPVRSRFGMDGDLGGIPGLGIRLVRPFEISPARGARTSVFLATSPQVAGRTGGYWVRAEPHRPSRQAQDPVAAARLWDESERLLAGAGFPVP